MAVYLCLRLCLFPIASCMHESTRSVGHATETAGHTPYVDAVSTDENRGGIWILLHGLRHAIFEVFLIGRILDNWHLQGVKVRQRIPHAAYTHALDHLNFEKFNIRCAADNKPH